MGDELGGLTTSLGLFASPPLLLSTESVVVIEWKGMRASTTASFYTGRGRSRCKIAVLMPFHTIATTTRGNLHLWAMDWPD